MTRTTPAASRAAILGAALALGPLAIGIAAPCRADDASMRALIQRGRDISNVFLCADDKRQTEHGPRDKDDLDRVTAAATSGAASCQILLGGWYENGEGMPADFAQAAHWYETASAITSAGFVPLGRMAELGRGRPASAKDAVVLYRKAADANDPAGQVALGRMLESGSGAAKDPAAAADLYRKAAARWNEEAWSRLDALQSRTGVLTAEQIDGDRHLWRGLLIKRISARISDAVELRAFTQQRAATLTLAYGRGATLPAATIKSGSGDAQFDEALAAVGKSIPMPPAPIYSSKESSYGIDLPIRYVPQEPDLPPEAGQATP